MVLSNREKNSGQKSKVWRQQQGTQICDKQVVIRGTFSAGRVIGIGSLVLPSRAEKYGLLCQFIHLGVWLYIIWSWLEKW